MKIFLTGMPGSGKSTIGKMVAVELSYQFVDMDEEIERQEGKSISKIFEEEGELGFRKKERGVLLNLLERNENMVIASGGGAPAYLDNMTLINSSGISIYLKTTLGQLTENLKKSHSLRPLLKESPVESLARLLREREQIYAQSLFTVENKNPEDTVREILGKIRNIR